MTTFYDSFTGEKLEEPVCSKKSGHIFEKNMIEKHLELNSTCPITGQPLTMDDIVPLKVNKTVKPRPANANSIPGMLTILKNEWDSLMLEVYTLKKTLETTRQELAHSLYQYDAACRVIARLIRERDEARNALSKLQIRADQIEYQAKKDALADNQNGTVAKNNADTMETELPTSLINQINDTAIQLNNMRKEMKKNKNAFLDYSTKDMIMNYKVEASIPLKTSANSGLSCMDINKEQDQYLITGGINGEVILFNRNSSSVVTTYNKHTKIINDIAFIPRAESIVGITCSDDNEAHLIRYNQNNDQIVQSYVANQHKGPITSVSVHPIRSLVVLGSQDGSFSYHDVSQGSFLFSKALGDIPIHNVKIHPDGMIMAIGTSDGSLTIWNITEGIKLASIEAANTAIKCISFSENGYSFATSAFGENTVKIWDLRKLNQENVKTIQTNGDFNISSLSYDGSGQFLSIGGSSLLIYDAKSFENIATWKAHTDLISSARFGNYAKYISSVGLDSNLVFYS